MDGQWCPLLWHNLCQDASQDYVRELGLLYIDCAGVQVLPWCVAAFLKLADVVHVGLLSIQVFMLFSEKYVLTDIYCKLVSKF